MGKRVVVQDDAVEGTDKHNLTGVISSIPMNYTGVASFSYRGKMTDALSDFVKVDGVPVATAASRSSLNPGETAPGGGHHGDSGSGHLPPPPPDPGTGTITDPVGEGNPSASAGSTFVKIDGDKVLLDADKIDTCDGMSIPMNSTVTASGQSFVSCSA